MGAAAGHMRHPFDLNHVKTGNDLIKEFENIKKFVNENPVAIKIDGTNVSFKIIQPVGPGIVEDSAEKQFAADRGSTKLIDIEGVTLSNLSERFPEGHGMRPAITTLLSIFNEALKTKGIRPELEKLGLWDDPTKFFNTEYVEKTTNVVKYDKNFFAIHGVNQFYEKTNSRTGMKRPGASKPIDEEGKPIKDPSREIPYDAATLNSLVKKVAPVAKKYGFELFSTIPAKRKEIVSINYDASLSRPFPVTFNREEGPRQATLRERLTGAVLPPPKLYIPLVSGKKIPALGKQVYKLVTGATAKDDSVSIERQIPLEEAFGEDEEIHKLAVDGATFWHATRVLGNEVLKSLTTDGMGEATDHEGVVLRMGYEGPVKVTGDFILGGEVSEFRQIAEAVESSSESEDDNIIVLYPGGFKPPHAGHFELAKRYADDPAVSKVIMLIGPKERKSGDGSVTITKENAIHILNEYYIPHLGDKVTVMDTPGGEENPMRAAFKWVEEKAKFGETYALAASDKDPGRAKDFYEGHCHPEGKYCKEGVDIAVHPVETSPIMYSDRTDEEDGVISATVMRDDLAKGDKENFITNLPERVQEQGDEIFNYLGEVKKTEESPSPSSSDEEPIEEISSAAGGSVEGAPTAGGGPWEAFDKEENERHRSRSKLKENKQDSETNYKYISDDRKKNMSAKELLQEKQKIEEITLRKHVRGLLNKKYKKLNEENKLRLMIRGLINEAAIEDTPSRSTGINKLVSALKIVLPTIERAYKSLTTSSEQRDSYKRHLVKAFIDTLSPQDAISGVGDGGEEGVEPLTTEEPAGMEPIAAELPPAGEESPFEGEEEIPLQEQADPVADSPEGIDIEVAGGAGDEDPFRTKEDDEATAKTEEEGKETEKKRKKEAFKDVEGEEKDFPALPGLDETGRDEAVDIYKKTIDAVIRTYRRLHSDRDKAHFKDYLITNLLLYFDKWESDIGGVPELSTPEYEAEKAAKEKYTAGGEAPAGELPPAPLQETIKKSILATILKHTG